MKVVVGVSNRHVHLNSNDYKKLFGDTVMNIKKEVNQPGEYASDLTVTLKTDKNTISNVRVMGPIRSYSQIELSNTDSYTLGVKPPLRMSGDINNAPCVTVIGPNGSVDIPCIIQIRHIHISREMLEKYGYDPNKEKMILINTKKSGILGNVLLKVTDNAFFELHIDTDEANAFMLKTGDIVDIIDY